jgi:hypothetical protein
VTVDAGDAGAIGLHLRVRDGVADVRIDGLAAPVAEARAGELRAALAREGLALGTLHTSLPDRGGGHEHAERRGDDDAGAAAPRRAPPRPATAAPAPAPARHRPGGVHVEA